MKNVKPENNVDLIQVVSEVSMEQRYHLQDCSTNNRVQGDFDWKYALDNSPTFVRHQIPLPDNEGDKAGGNQCQADANSGTIPV